MIAKNEAANIAPCLTSVKNIVSQIVIADTGSTDDTIAIARGLGATVIEFAWTNHFGDARNAALRAMTTDWILSLDADEELDRNAVQAIPALIRKPNVAGYILPVRNYTLAKEIRAGSSVGQANDLRHSRAAAAGSYFVYEKCRLFRRHSDIHFTGRIHEQVELTIRAAKLKLRPAALCIHNFGLIERGEDMGRKLAYYRDLLRLRAEEEPGDFRGWTYLGRMEYDSFNNRTEALRNFQRALELNPGCVEALLFTAMIYLDLGRAQDAIPFLAFNPPDDSSTVQKHRLLGDAFCQAGRLQEAQSAYRNALRLCEREPELESKLGLTEVRLGQTAEGLRRLERAAAVTPPRPVVQDRLMKAYVLLNMLPEAAAVAESVAALAPHPKAFLRAASIHAQSRQWEQSARLLRRGLDLFPNAPELQAAYSESVALARS
ncbi:MAG TPA: glycosyltransferase [Terriglobales bacterium]|nr:glycosyltransferase [Terriglobales bacterium]